MSPLQEPVLEHAPSEAQDPQVSCENVTQNSGVVKSVSNTENVQLTSIELAREIDLLLSRTEKYVARAAYSIAGQLMYVRESRAISC